MYVHIIVKRETQHADLGKQGIVIDWLGRGRVD